MCALTVDQQSEPRHRPSHRQFTLPVSWPARLASLNSPTLLGRRSAHIGRSRMYLEREREERTNTRTLIETNKKEYGNGGKGYERVCKRVFKRGTRQNIMIADGCEGLPASGGGGGGRAKRERLALRASHCRGKCYKNKYTHFKM